MDLRDGMEIVLRIKGDIVLLEIAGAKLGAVVDYLRGTIAALRGIEEEIVGVVRGMDQIRSEVDCVVRRDLSAG